MCHLTFWRQVGQWVSSSISYNISYNIAARHAPLLCSWGALLHKQKQERQTGIGAFRHSIRRRLSAPEFFPHWSAQHCCIECLQSGVSKAFAALLSPTAQRTPWSLVTDTVTTEPQMEVLMQEKAVPYTSTGTAPCSTMQTADSGLPAVARSLLDCVSLVKME